ncbi:MAG: WS/DGAT/MGAT family O-acyltransferase [Betaproteobacteria bacterium]
MERLSPLDAGFLDAEDEDRHASLAIASVALFDGPAPSQDAIIAAISGRLPLVPRYRQKVRRVPFDLGHPVWVDDPHFDLSFHIRRTAVPAPGDEQALCRLVARVMSHRLDRDRPLWEAWVIEGLAGGRWAVLSKVHHCLADGLSANQLYRLFFDESPESPAPIEDTWVAEPEPSTLSLTAGALRDLAGNPFAQLQLLVQGARAPLALTRRVVDAARGLTTLAGVLRPVSSSTLTGPIGKQRRYGVARASLPTLSATAKAFGVTINDVVLAAISGALRALLLERGERPTPNAVRSLVPVSVRSHDHQHVIDNQISLMLPLLPVDVSDPVARLTAVHDRLVELKLSKEAEAGAAVTELARYEPFPPVSWGIRLAARLPHRNIVTVTTNVPGPRRPLYFLGHRMLEILPYVPIAVRLRTGIAILTYCDQVTFGITADYDSAPEIDLLATAIDRCLAELVDAAQPARSAGPEPRARRAVSSRAKAEPAARAVRTSAAPTKRTAAKTTRRAAAAAVSRQSKR